MVIKRIFMLAFAALFIFFICNINYIYAEEGNETQVNGTVEETKPNTEETEKAETEMEEVTTEASNATTSDVVVEPAKQDEASNETVNEPIVGETAQNGTSSDDDIHGGEIYDIQKVKVFITKRDEETKEILPGATLQVIDSEGNVVEEWVSTNKAHEIQLPNGTYKLHEKEAPEGYEIAADVEFTVKVEIAHLDAGSDASATPCPHYTGTQMYYVEIESKKHEVYCINQNWETPDENSTYDGEILDSSSIRDFTKQTTPIGLNEEDPIKVIMSDGPIDVSDQSLTDEELYDKILDIIYHRHIATQELSYEYTTEEIRFITEVALKNYTNAGLTERQYNVKATEALIAAFDAAGVVYGTYVKDGVTYVSYLKHNYRDYVYTPDVPLGQDIVKTDYGKGNSFGQMVAGHWNSYSNKNYLHPDADPNTQAHNAKNKQADRDTVARYYELFKFLISSKNPHPKDMNLYIYSSDSVPSDLSGNNNDGKYQNLLGITGYFEDVKQQTQEVEMYNTRVRKVTVQKVWDDKDDYNKLRPMHVEVELYAFDEKIDTVELSASNNWTYSWEGLDYYKDGKVIEYSIKESEVPEYDTLIEGDMDTVFVITNSYYGTGGDDTPPSDNPKTADNIYIYITMLLASIFGIITIKNKLA